METKAPWLKVYGDVPFNLKYPDCTMCGAVEIAAEKYPDNKALSFMGKHTDYKTLVKTINAVAESFLSIGVSEGDTVTLCLPNIPQTVFCLYALNKIGAKVSVIHPLSAVGEIEFFLRETKSNFAVVLDRFYYKFDGIAEKCGVGKIVVTKVSDALPFFKSAVYGFAAERKYEKPPYGEKVLKWSDFLKNKAFGKPLSPAKKGGDDPAVILFSGGTTGKTKGILLTNRNFNALAIQTEAMCHDKVAGMSMLAAMPMFHGFGLGVCVHTMLVAGGLSVLVPEFNVKSYAGLIKKERPNYIAGVPTLFEAIVRNDYLNGVKLDCLKGVFSGGDSLPSELKKKFDEFLQNHGAKIKIREGYGTTECVTASCLTPYHTEKAGSIGLPFPDTYYKICKTGTTDEVPFKTDGEICISGPTVMLGYINNPEETSATLKRHDDGRIWLHTGDLGSMDEEGFVYFKQRIKRMIITSGYNVYPSQVEKIIDSHKDVLMSCVIGVRDEYKMQRVKAFVVLKDGVKESDEVKQSILEHCKQYMAKYALPKEIEIRKELPKTIVGKIAYTELEKEENEK